MLCCGAAASLFAVGGLWRRLASPWRIGAAMLGLALVAGPATANDLRGTSAHKICGQFVE